MTNFGALAERLSEQRKTKITQVSIRLAQAALPPTHHELDQLFRTQILPSVEQAHEVLAEASRPQSAIASLPALALAATALLLDPVANLNHSHNEVLMRCSTKLLALRLEATPIEAGDLECALTMVCFCLAQVNAHKNWVPTLNLLERLMQQINRVDDVLCEALVEILWTSDPELVLDSGIQLIRNLINLSVRSQTDFGTNIMNLSLLNTFCVLLDEPHQHKNKEEVFVWLKDSLLSLTRQSYRNSLQLPCLTLAKLAKGWTNKENTSDFPPVKGEIPTTAPCLTGVVSWERLWLTIASSGASETFSRVMRWITRPGLYQTLYFLADPIEERRILLHKCCQRGHDNILRPFLSHGAKLVCKSEILVDVTDAGGWVALHCASRNNRFPCALLLVEYGCDIARMEDDKWTPLHLASQKGAVEIVKLLLSNGADKEVQDERNATPLFFAAEKGEVEVAQLLISIGANINAKKRNDTTCLHIAAQEGHLAMVRLLIAHKVEINAVDDVGWSALHIAASKNYIDICKELIAVGANVNLAERNMFTPLHICAEHGYSELAKIMIESGALPNAKDTDGWAPLHLAIYKNKLDASKLLLTSGADVNAAQNRRLTALHVAAQEDLPEACELLLEFGANVNCVDDYRSTPLHLAAAEGNVDVAKLLLRHQADYEIKDSHGYSPLHLACQANRLTMVEFLFTLAGVTADVCDTDQWTPLHLAAQLGHVAIVRALIAHGASVNLVEVDMWSALHLACERKRVEVVKALLEHPSIDIELGQNNGYTALHFAAQENCPEIAVMLLSKGAKIDPWDLTKNYTPLGLACFGGKEEVAAILLERGADVNQQDTLHTTPLAVAVREKFLNLTLLLLKYKADPFICDTSQQYPFDFVPSPDFLAEILEKHPALVPRLKITHHSSSLIDVPFKRIADYLATNTHLIELHVDEANFTLNLSAEAEEQPEASPAQLAAKKAALIQQLSLQLAKNLTLTHVVLSSGEDSVSYSSDVADLFLTLGYRNELLATSQQACFSLAMLAMWASVPDHQNPSLDSSFHRCIIEARCPLLLSESNRAGLKRLGLDAQVWRSFYLFLYTSEFEWTRASVFRINQVTEIANIPEVLLSLQSVAEALDFKSLLEECQRELKSINEGKPEESVTSRLSTVRNFALAVFEADFERFHATMPNPDFTIHFHPLGSAAVVQIPCHRSLLASRWRWFNRLMSANMKEAQTGTLALFEKELGLTQSALHGLVYYFYTGNPSKLSKADCEVLLSLLDFFEIGNDDDGLIVHHFFIKACQDATEGGSLSPRGSSGSDSTHLISAATASATQTQVADVEMADL